MDSFSVAPAPAALPSEAASPRPAAEEGAPGAKPFEQALRQELARPDSATANAAQPRPPKAEAPKPAAAPSANAHAATPQWAALLESAGLAEDADADAELGEGTDLARIAPDPESAPAAALIGSDPVAIPVQPLLAEPARGRSPEAGLAQDNRGAVDARLKTGAFDAHASRSADHAAIQGLGATAEASPSAAESLVTAFAAERAGLAETPISAMHSPALDGLASGAFAPRWAPAALAETAAAQAPATARIDTPLGNSGWGDAFQQKIVWLVDRQQQSAELHVNPPHLGPIEIALNLGEDATHIAFTSPHAAVREAIEASLPELRTALGEKGLSLGQATVGADSQAAREQLRGEGRTSATGGRDGAGDVPVEIPLPPRLVQRGLVDIFA